jgi:hypothetical protein
MDILRCHHFPVWVSVKVQSFLYEAGEKAGSLESVCQWLHTALGTCHQCPSWSWSVDSQSRRLPTPLAYGYSAPCEIATARLSPQRSRAGSFASWYSGDSTLSPGQLLSDREPIRSKITVKRYGGACSPTSNFLPELFPTITTTDQCSLPSGSPRQKDISTVGHFMKHHSPTDPSGD